MRVATFNILNGRNASDDHVSLDVFRAAVASLDADVLALQEVDRNQPRSGHADLTAAAADAMGAVDHRFVAALSGSPGATWIAATGSEQPDAAAYGIALLSRHPVVAWEVIRLPTLHTPVPMWFRGSRLPTFVRDEPRVAVAALVDAPGGPLTVANTHLSFVPWWGRRQLHSLARSLSGLGRPLVLAGDLNMVPERAAAITGMRSLVTAPTFPVQSPHEQLDHVLSGDAWPRAAGEARQLPISDHRALVVDLTG
ncbi:endonuclease/exonuclease/phosphatase family protein [Aeromicrobium sp. 9AM]|uniref:endonuclease/exonuclease/phosphatase family protein n=1 Tax=Aeromicrobium sp. 9AM TaxID=2653126 RepID=UPI0012F159DE|nr:endonuclease/exonuclease/phosphatase family protein [Aeromicrobium sp. 9AM]VXB13068.1 Endonuclease [Aeromicrobium sp. 9AM]